MDTTFEVQVDITGQKSENFAESLKVYLVRYFDSEGAVQRKSKASSLEVRETNGRRFRYYKDQILNWDYLPEYLELDQLQMDSIQAEIEEGNIGQIPDYQEGMIDLEKKFKKFFKNP